MKYSKVIFGACIILFISFGKIYESSAFAETIGKYKISLEIKPGPLSLRPSLKRIQFNFKREENVSYAKLGRLTITDATGSGRGWHVTLKASPLIQIVKSGIEPRTLPSGSLALSLKGAKIKVGEGSGVPPSWIGGTEHIIDGDIPVTLLSANIGQGMGSYLVEFGAKTLKLKVSKNYLSGGSTYQSVLTWSIQQGP